MGEEKTNNPELDLTLDNGGEGGTGKNDGGEHKEDKYEIPEAYAKDEGFKNFIKESGLGDAQIKAGIEYFEGRQAAADKEYADNVAKLSDELVKEWGEDLSNKMAIAKNTVKLLDKEVPGMVNFLRDTGSASHPIVVRMLEAVGRLLAEKPKGNADVKDEGKHEDGEKPSKKNKKTGWDTPATSRLYPSN